MIYLDNAATTSPKPEIVIKEVNRALRHYSANPGRGGHSPSLAAAKAVFQTRSLVKDFFHASSEENVIFTSGCTHSLNTVIKGVLKQAGATVVRCLSRLAGGYINLMRGTPLLLQVLLINFGVFGSIRIEKIIIGVIACGLNSAAYVAEIVRGGIMSVEKGQTEAGRSLGLSGFRTMMYIVLPQAAKSALPAMCNEFISLIKETSVLSYIALTELTKAGDYIRSRTFSAFTPYIVSGLLYLIVTLTLTTLIGKLERRLRNSDH